MQLLLQVSWLIHHFSGYSDSSGVRTIIPQFLQAEAKHVSNLVLQQLYD
jgi:hypothetical protein